MNHGQGTNVAVRWANPSFPEIATACFTGGDAEADFRVAAPGVRDVTLRLELEGRRRRGIGEARQTGAARRGGEANVPERCAPALSSIWCRGKDVTLGRV